MPTVHREVERTYVADDGFELPPMTELVAGTDARRHDDVAPVAPVAEGKLVRPRLAASYVDSAGLRLATAGGEAGRSGTLRQRGRLWGRNSLHR
jgi:hypothetical protein